MPKLLYKTKSKTKFECSLQISPKEKVNTPSRQEMRIKSKTQSNQVDLNVTGGNFAYLYFKVFLTFRNKILPFQSFMDKVPVKFHLVTKETRSHVSIKCNLSIPIFRKKIIRFDY